MPTEDASPKTKRVVGAGGEWETSELPPTLEEQIGAGEIPGLGPVESKALEGPDKDVFEYLQQQGVPKELLGKALSARRATEDVPEEYRDRIPTKPRFIGAKALVLGLGAMILGRNLNLVGPPASGKNRLAETLAYIFNLPLFEVEGHAQMQIGDITADKTLDVDKDGHNRVVWAFGQMAKAMQVGGLVSFSEINVMPPEIGTALHGLEVSRRRIDIPGYGMVEAHPNFRLVASMNRDLAGTAEMNQATMDRFVVVPLPPARGDAVKRIIAQESELTDRKALQSLVGVWDSLIQNVENGTLSETVLSMRGLIDAAQLTHLGISLRDALTVGLVEKIQNPTERADVANIIELI